MRAKNEQKELHYCGECALAEADWQFANLSVDGKPTLVSCLFSGKFKKVVSEKACENFAPRQAEKTEK